MKELFREYINTKNWIVLKNKYCPVRTCASCEYTYWGGWKGNKACPKCGFAHYGAWFVYDSWFWVFWELLTNCTYKKRKNFWG